LHPDCGGIAKLNEYFGTSYESFNAFLKDAVIVHLTNQYKPWKYKDVVMHKEWMSYFKKSLFRKQKLSLTNYIKKESLNNKAKRVIKKILKNLPAVSKHKELQ